MGSVVKQGIVVNARSSSVSIYLPNIPERLVNNHQLQDGAISLNSYFKGMGGIACLCKMGVGTCADFAAYPSPLLDPNRKALWSKVRFSTSRNRFYCRRKKDRSDPTCAFRGASLNSSLWRQMLGVI